MGMGLKCVESGLLCTPNAFLQDPWNVVDFVILLVDILNLPSWSSDYWQRAARMGLALRGLRALTASPDMQALFTAVLRVLRPISSVFLLALVVFLIFGIVATQLFGGKLAACNDPGVVGRAECVGTYLDPGTGILMPRVWRKPDANFDNIGKGMLTLFELASLDNWSDAMYAAMDVTGWDLQPRTNASPQNALFFIAFVCIGSFFVLRVFVGVFTDQLGFITGNKLLTDKQLLWRDMNRFAASARPQRLRRRPAGRAQAACFDMIHHRWFPWAMVCMLLLNLALLASYSHSQPAYWDDIINGLDFVFVMLYAAELAVRLAAESFRNWRTSRWNQFEALLLIGAIITLLPAPGSARDIAARPFRFLRAFRLVRFVTGLRLLAATVILSLPAMASIVGLLAILIFLYAGVGTQLFVHVKWGLNLTRQQNFDTFASSFLVLYQSMTGEGWRGIMNDLKRQPPYCTAAAPPQHPRGDCGFRTGATAYFVSYIILCSYIVTNLFVGAIMEYVAFGVLRGQALSPAHLGRFKVVWAQFDPEASGLLGIHCLRDFVVALQGPLGHKAPPWALLRNVKFEAWRLRQPGLGLRFRDAIVLLMHERLGPQALTYDVRKAREQEVAEMVLLGSATRIQAAVRGFLVRRRSPHQLRETLRALGLGTPSRSTSPEPTLGGSFDRCRYVWDADTGGVKLARGPAPAPRSASNSIWERKRKTPSQLLSWTKDVAGSSTQQLAQEEAALER